MNKNIITFLTLSLLSLNLNVSAKNITSPFCREDKKTSAVDSTLTLAKAKIDKWNDASTKGDLEALGKLYAEDIVLHGSKMKKADCINAKKTLFSQTPNFKQSILEYYGCETINRNGNKLIKCNFSKKSTTSNGVVVTDSYLIYALMGSEWKIIEESDWISARNTAKYKKASEVINGNYCFHYDADIVTIANGSFSIQDGFKLSVSNGKIAGIGTLFDQNEKIKYSLDIKGKINDMNEWELSMTVSSPMISSITIKSSPESQGKMTGKTIQEIWKLHDDKLTCIKSENRDGTYYFLSKTCD